MKKEYFVVVSFILIMNVLLLGCANKEKVASVSDNTQAGSRDENQTTSETIDTDVEVIKSLVERFGKTLQKVSLLAPENTLKDEIKKNYKDYLSPVLLEKWLESSQNALGKKVSSPWPDRIDVIKVEKITDDEYKVTGKIIEITSVELEKGGSAEEIPVNLIVIKIGNQWLIDGISTSEHIVYKNGEYGFKFLLPVSWANYTIVGSTWEGEPANGSSNKENGPMISIRHPEWTVEKERQDIPLMIFTLKQWEALQQEKFHIGAAPMNPSELGRNNKYVFAIPARYNFAFPLGFEEVEEIIEGDAIQPFDIDA